jgi:ADP-ribose pyrophosphatase YjhB (NUDIX family)
MDQKDTYFVAVKVFLVRERDGKLLIMRDNFGDWDLPGGRIKKDEFETPLAEVIKRKMSEELGDDIRYTIGAPVVFMRHERQEAAPGNPTVRIFAIGYEGTLLDGGGSGGDGDGGRGEIRTSERHPESLWVDPRDFNPEDYFKGGWLKGVEEWIEMRSKKL